MKNRLISLLGLILLFAVFFCRLAVSQTIGLEAQRTLVAKLRIHRNGQSDETAAALLVGKDERNAYFITAYHALGPNSQGVTPSSVQLQFFASPETIPAKAFENFDEANDLGVVSIAVSSLPSKLPRIAKTNAVAETPTRIIGHPSAGNWSAWSGTVQNENAGTNDPRHFTTNRDDSLAGGYSGGPVFDSHGHFLGMHTSTESTYGIAMKSGDIFAQLAAWHVPTNNFTSVTDPVNVPTDTSEQDREAINRLLDTYSDFYHRKDAADLWSLWPEAPPQTKQAIENYFHNARSINRQIADRNINLKKSHATVTGRCLEEFIPTSGSSQRFNDSIVFEMEKRNNAWIIVSVK